MLLSPLKRILGVAVITLQEICQYTNELLKVDEFEDFCPNGMQVEGGQQVKKIGTAVSASLETIERAALENIDCLIVHHGLFWNRDPYPVVGTKLKKIKALIANNISLLAYHLPLDAHQEYGNNWRAAKDLGWRDLEPFGKIGGQFIGVKGRIDKTDRDSCIARLSDYYDHPCQLAPGGRDEVAKLGCISGGAYKSVLAAAEEGLDCFITGSFDEPAWHWAREEGINFLAFGHHATERVGPRALGVHLGEVFNCPQVFIDVDNPF